MADLTFDDFIKMMPGAQYIPDSWRDEPRSLVLVDVDVPREWWWWEDLVAQFPPLRGQILDGFVVPLLVEQILRWHQTEGRWDVRETLPIPLPGSERLVLEAVNSLIDRFELYDDEAADQLRDAFDKLAEFDEGHRHIATFLDCVGDVADPELQATFNALTRDDLPILDAYLVACGVLDRP